ncbi:hypothetical protein C8F01DRAFT_1151744 [Mycena amicta]|nr:hypothetical protein C8F01DRAFT_1151744 [Mycena amicta]
MTQKLFFLDLATEIILKCILHLSIDDIAICLRVGNRFLASVITQSQAIQYRAELEQAGVHEVPHKMRGVSIAERLALLRNREARWRTLSPASRYSIPLGMDAKAIVLLDFVDGLYFAAQPARWRTLYSGKPFSNFGLALAEHDLFVIITCAPCHDDPSTTSVDAHLFSFTTGEPHPLATCPVIHLYRFPTLAPRHKVELDAGIEILGRAMAISFRFFADFTDDSLNNLYLLDWQTGLHYFTPIPISTHRFFFLSPSTLLIPQATDNTMEIITLPDTASEKPTTHWTQNILALALPSTLPTVEVDPYSYRSRVSSHLPMGVPVAQREHIQSHFIPRADKSLLFLQYYTVRSHTLDQFQLHVVILHRALFLGEVRRRLANMHGKSCAGYTRVSWSDWGPKCARWMDPLHFGAEHDFVLASSAGMRIVGLLGKSDLDDSTPTPGDVPTHALQVLNFNPREVARAARRGVEEGNRASESTAPQSVASVRAQPHVNPHLGSSESTALGISFVQSTSREGILSGKYQRVHLSDEGFVGISVDAQGVGKFEVLHFG